MGARAFQPCKGRFDRVFLECVVGHTVPRSGEAKQVLAVSEFFASDRRPAMLQSLIHSRNDS